MHERRETTWGGALLRLGERARSRLAWCNPYSEDRVAAGLELIVQQGIPSRTAWRVAFRRAMHQTLDVPPVFEDPLARLIVGAGHGDALRNAASEDTLVLRRLRAFLAARSRFAEEELARAVSRGAGQFVILGAGLDTFALRNPYAALRVFEVDHPATQAWKQDVLGEAGLEAPPSLTFVPVDFERQSLPEALHASGFDARQPSFFSWLGVTMYLTLEAVTSVFEFVGGLRAASGLVFDYAGSQSQQSVRTQRALELFAQRMAAIGEPWTLFFEPGQLLSLLRSSGFTAVADLDGDDINRRYFAGRADGMRVGSLGHLAAARRNPEEISEM